MYFLVVFSPHVTRKVASLVGSSGVVKRLCTKIITKCTPLPRRISPKTLRIQNNNDFYSVYQKYHFGPPEPFRPKPVPTAPPRRSLCYTCLWKTRVPLPLPRPCSYVVLFTKPGFCPPDHPKSQKSGPPGDDITWHDMSSHDMLWYNLYHDMSSHDMLW